MSREIYETKKTSDDSIIEQKVTSPSPKLPDSPFGTEVDEGKKEPLTRITVPNETPIINADEKYQESVRMAKETQAPVIIAKEEFVSDKNSENSLKPNPYAGYTDVNIDGDTGTMHYPEQIIEHHKKVEHGSITAHVPDGSEWTVADEARYIKDMEAYAQQPQDLSLKTACDIAGKQKKIIADREGWFPEATYSEEALKPFFKKHFITEEKTEEELAKEAKIKTLENTPIGEITPDDLKELLKHSNEKLLKYSKTVQGFLNRNNEGK